MDVSMACSSHRRALVIFIGRARRVKNDEEDKENMPPGDDNEEEHYWLKNELYNLKNEDKGILLSRNTWLNDRTMDAAQKLICKSLGTLSTQ